MRSSASLNLHSANMQTTLQVLYLLSAEQLVQRKMSGLIVYHLNFDSWETPKAHPEATTSVFERRAVAEINACFFFCCNLPVIVM